jgi:hypothetical protein
VDATSGLPVEQTKLMIMQKKMLQKFLLFPVGRCRIAEKIKMRLITSIILAYILTGLSQVWRDLFSSPLDKPGWAIQPTLGTAIFVAIAWVTRPILENIASARGQIARGIAFGLTGIFVQMCFVTGFIWCCISASVYFLDNIILQVIVAGLFILVGGLIVMPIVTLLMVPVIFIVAIPLDLIFPRKKD